MTTMGLTTGILAGVFIGGFLGWILSHLIDEVCGKIATVIGCVLIVFCLAGFGCSSEEKDFNHGVCPRCDTKYEAIERSHSETYYECPNCYFGTWY